MAASPPTVPSLTADRTPPVRQHVAYLDGMRALAALFVVLTHFVAYVQFEGAALPAWLKAIAALTSFGHYAVDVFIVLSGFCLALPVVRGNGQLAGGALKFFGKRARRILPPYFFTLGISLLLIWLVIGHRTGTLWDTCLPVDWKGTLTHLFLVQDLARGENSKINYPLWSISVEWRIYFLFPFLMALRRRWGAVLVAAAAFVVAYAIVFIGKSPAQGVWPLIDISASAPQYLGLFALGLLGADISHGKNAPLPLLRLPTFAMALLGGTTLLMVVTSGIKLGHGISLPLPFRDFFVGLWAVSLLVAAANGQIGWLDRALSWRPLVFIGTFAYSLYLIHAPLIQLLWQYVFVSWHSNAVSLFLAFTFLGTPLIVGVSYLFFLC